MDDLPRNPLAHSPQQIPCLRIKLLNYFKLDGGISKAYSNVHGRLLTFRNNKISKRTKLLYYGVNTE